MTESRTRILLVDDYPDALETWGLFFELKGYQVLTAGDGQSAVDLAVANRPDVIVMDLDLPVLTGYEAARIIRSLAATSRIPLIAATGYSQGTPSGRSAPCRVRRGPGEAVRPRHSHRRDRSSALRRSGQWATAVQEYGKPLLNRAPQRRRLTAKTARLRGSREPRRRASWYAPCIARPHGSGGSDERVILRWRSSSLLVPRSLCSHPGSIGWGCALRDGGRGDGRSHVPLFASRAARADAAGHVA